MKAALRDGRPVSAALGMAILLLRNSLSAESSAHPFDDVGHRHPWRLCQESDHARLFSDQDFVRSFWFLSMVFGLLELCRGELLPARQSS